ncbi:hypothetical protein [Neolewinella maritima]|nr:hypothetical protein [Neolewinella maritima]
MISIDVIEGDCGQEREKSHCCDYAKYHTYSIGSVAVGPSVNLA